MLHCVHKLVSNCVSLNIDAEQVAQWAFGYKQLSGSAGEEYDKSNEICENRKVTSGRIKIRS